MRKLIILCLIVSKLAIAATIVQSRLGGNASSVFTTGGTLTTSAVGFSSNTTVGSLLYMAIWVRDESTNATCNIVAPPTITTSGFTWLNPNGIGALFQDNATANHCGYATEAYILNASQMLSTTTTTVSVTIPSSNHCTCTLEFALYEISGVSGVVFANQANSSDGSGTPSNPNCSTTITPTSAFFCTLTGLPGSNLTAASGYTLGPNATAATIGQTSYALAISGSLSTQFTGNLTQWSTAGALFSLTAAGPVPRRKGWVF